MNLLKNITWLWRSTGELTRDLADSLRREELSHCDEICRSQRKMSEAAKRSWRTRKKKNTGRKVAEHRRQLMVKVKDILHVMQILGHKNIRNTLVYTQLVDLKDDDYVSKVAKTVEEVCQLVEAGFEYVCKMDDAKIFRKRK